MNQAEEAKLLEQIERWNDVDEFSRCIDAIEAIPEQERGYLLTLKLSRAYSNLAVLSDNSAHGEDGEVDGELLRHAIRLLESVGFPEELVINGEKGRLMNYLDRLEQGKAL